jgi:hypothetical protein
LRAVPGLSSEVVFSERLLGGTTWWVFGYFGLCGEENAAEDEEDLLEEDEEDAD